MKIEIDISELENFKNELETYAKNIQPVIKETTRNAALLLYREIVKLTPVDTGNLRAAWTIEGTVAFRNGNTYELTLSNNVTYGWYVNYGHRLKNGRWWEGKHFVETSEQLVKDEMFVLVQHSIEKYLKNINGVD